MQIVKSLALRNYQRVGGGSYVDVGLGEVVLYGFLCISLFLNVRGLTRFDLERFFLSHDHKGQILHHCGTLPIGVTFEPLSRQESGRERDRVRDGGKELLTEEGQQTRLSLGAWNDGSAG